MPDRTPFDDLDPELLDRFLAGEHSEEDSVRVRRWLMARPDAARRLAAFLDQVDDDGDRDAMPDVASSWETLRARMHSADASAAADADAEHRPAPMPADRRRRREWRWGMTAAAACVALVAGVSYVASRVQPPAAEPPLRSYVTATRERSELRLADGTRVHLAPGSKLRTATDFGTERRDVYLEGEAYFEVVHDERRPFTVFANNTSTRDIGTAFSIRAYPQDSTVTVVVREGEVALSGAGRLRAGDVGRVSAEGRAVVQRGVQVDSLLGWMRGRLAMTDAPLRQVVQDLRRWYDVDVQLADSSIAALPFTGTLDDVSPDAALELIAATLGLEIRHDGARVVLAPIPGRTPGAR
jgi:ferric-dicitrate binding protein FerR (iron transport regulator)